MWAKYEQSLAKQASRHTVLRYPKERLMGGEVSGVSIVRGDHKNVSN
jgi:hypothetical protein